MSGRRGGPQKREGEQRAKDFPKAEKGFLFSCRPCLSICEVRLWRTSGHGSEYQVEISG